MEISGGGYVQGNCPDRCTPRSQQPNKLQTVSQINRLKAWRNDVSSSQRAIDEQSWSGILVNPLESRGNYKKCREILLSNAAKRRGARYVVDVDKIISFEAISLSPCSSSTKWSIQCVELDVEPCCRTIILHCRGIPRVWQQRRQAQAFLRPPTDATINKRQTNRVAHASPRTTAIDDQAAQQPLSTIYTVSTKTQRHLLFSIKPQLNAPRLTQQTIASLAVSVIMSSTSLALRNARTW